MYTYVFMCVCVCVCVCLFAPSRACVYTCGGRGAHALIAVFLESLTIQGVYIVNVAGH